MNSKIFNPMLKNKVAIVTGGSGHIGNEIIKALNTCGVKVLNLDVKKSQLNLGKNFHFEYVCVDCGNVIKSALFLAKFFSHRLIIS